MDDCRQKGEGMVCLLPILWLGLHRPEKLPTFVPFDKTLSCMSASLIRFKNVTFRKYGHIVFDDTSWEIRQGENWAVTGVNGSGKTTFLEAVEGQLPVIRGVAEDHTDKSVASVYFSDRQINYGGFYYQQRYHACETEGIVTVREFLGLPRAAAFPELRELNIHMLLDMEIIKLSNGQFKKMLIAKALLKAPRLLLLDNLFTGLDVAGRAYISDTLQRIAGMGTQIVMAADSGTLPDVITHQLEVDRFAVVRSAVRFAAVSQERAAERKPLPELPAAPEQPFEVAVRLDEATVRYGDRMVIDRVSWTVRRGEKWALAGPNGAGKTMLLSLIFADHPQAYANHIVLFDRRRGSGESIWDIKDRIGFVSPEMHVYDRREISCTDIALEELRGNPYARRTVSEEEKRRAEGLFAYFSLSGIAGRSFQRVSTGQRNLVLLIRALVKNPAMLIMDEPFQGLDAEKTELARTLLDEYCRERTMIFVSHHPQELPSCIRRCLWMENGKAHLREPDLEAGRFFQ
ncbi:MAG: ATP-binding cassette domain-containing protein [Bacteroidales bacterium]|jgi:molybdate transport system ATP-binding protein|nr:ATP-binding cassette domain-containing protein [Bacteroidales bacterium]